MDNIFTPKSMHDFLWRSYNSDFKGEEDSSRTQLALGWIKNMRPKVVLDLGCGPAYLAKIIKRDLPKTTVDGFDFSSVAMEHARQNLNRYWQLDIDKTDIPVSDETYDAVVCLEFIEHIYDIQHGLTEIKRVLKKSGKVLISVPNLAYWRYRLQLLLGQVPHPEVNDERHLHMFNFSTLRDRLSQAGLKVRRCWGYGRRLPILAHNCPKLFSSTIFVEASRIDI
jgi:SAM-dependent methyltransferase